MIVSSLAAAALFLIPAVPPLPVEPVPPRPSPAVDASVLHRSGTQVRVPPGTARPPGVSARSWLVADAGSGAVLAARDAHKRLRPASTLKVLFALTALHGLSPDRPHTVSRHELVGIGEGSSLVGLKEEVTYRVADLWRGVFLSSGNDAVRVLAGLNGGWQATTREMQATADALGARDTHVVSPDGYDEPGQVSSAYDLALFARVGLRDPDFARYCATPYAKFPGGGWSYGIRNTNRLVTGDDGVARYPGILGVKNGYTSGAGHTLIAAARRNGRTLVVTVMNPRRGGAYAVYEEARQLLDWGFAAAPRARPVGSLQAPPKAAATAAGPAASPAPVRAAPAPARPSATPQARATAPDDGPHVLLPLTFVSSACIAAATLWWVRRRTAPPLE
ncbi:D-alanyl-D-alanine carboxypeptidase family protein [Streptomyces sp. NRRL S-118]|uniref:D-alanyl-D-alanine carboxypeptidase family protein n=1 Tax=Streptomyces sp. NRRL S-118 TaxID=1463881 RepID=UPI0004C55A0F|nr:serine hydrolase [Streptomyces sp. NRRL S-118]